MSVEELAEVFKQLDKYLAKGCTKPSVFPFGALILFVRKKEGMLHMCINFRMLNKQKKINAYLILWVDEILYCLCKAEFFQKLS